jgi:hypothetical protein
MIYKILSTTSSKRPETRRIWYNEGAVWNMYTKKIVSAIIELKSGINKTHIFKKT